MTLSFTPINELTFADTLASGDYLLVWDVSAANLAKRLTLQVLANFLAAALVNIEWEGILNKPSTFPPSAHTHIKEQITDLSLDWQGITDKPSAFPPAVHTHIPADISGLNGAIDARLNNLPNGAIIGGVAHFFQNTPPATRIDGSPSVIGGSPLVIGDRWYDPTTRRIGSWNGTFWLTPKETILVTNHNNILINSTNTNFTPSFGRMGGVVSRANDLVFIHNTIAFFQSSVCTPSNRWEVTTNSGLFYINRGGVNASTVLIPASLQTTVIDNQSQLATHIQPYNSPLPLLPAGATETTPFDFVRLSIIKFGSAPLLYYVATAIEYSRIME